MSIKEIKWNNKQYSFNVRAGRDKGSWEWGVEDVPVSVCAYEGRI